MRKAFFWVTVASGALAAYVMYKRGSSPGDIVASVIKDPFGSLFNEMKKG